MDPESVKVSIETMAAYKQLFQSESNPFTPWIPVVSAVIGALAVAIPNGLAALYKSKKEREAAEGMFIAEVAAIVVYLNQRNYLDAMRRNKEELERRDKELNAAVTYTNGKPIATSKKVAYEFPESWDRIFNANLDRLGLVRPKLSRKVVVFYSMMKTLEQKLGPRGSLALVGEAGSYRIVIMELEALHRLGQDILGNPRDMKETIGLADISSSL